MTFHSGTRVSKIAGQGKSIVFIRSLCNSKFYQSKTTNDCMKSITGVQHMGQMTKLCAFCRVRSSERESLPKSVVFLEPSQLH